MTNGAAIIEINKRRTNIAPKQKVFETVTFNCIGLCTVPTYISLKIWDCFNCNIPKVMGINLLAYSTYLLI